MNKRISFPIAIIILLVVISLGILFIILFWTKYTEPDNVIIKQELSEIKIAAQKYYIANGSYIGLTTDLIPPRCSEKTYTIQISPDGKHYSSYARLCWPNTRILQSKRDAFWCVDSTDFSGKLEAKNIPSDVYNCSLQKEAPPKDETADWKTYRNEELGYEFHYPEELDTRYISINIHPFGWPPKVSIASIDPEFVCEEIQGKLPSGYGSQAQVTINGVIYCVLKTSSGAAGSSYVEFKYITNKDNKQLTFEFTLRYVNCGVFLEGEEAFKECEEEREEFNEDLLADQIISTFRFID